MTRLMQTGAQLSGEHVCQGAQFGSITYLHRMSSRQHLLDQALACACPADDSILSRPWHTKVHNIHADVMRIQVCSRIPPDGCLLDGRQLLVNFMPLLKLTDR